MLIPIYLSYSGKEKIRLYHLEDKMSKEYDDEYEKICYICKRPESKA